VLQDDRILGSQSHDFYLRKGIWHQRGIEAPGQRDLVYPYPFPAFHTGKDAVGVPMLFSLEEGYNSTGIQCRKLSTEVPF
jgi:hypothetical protein